MNNIDLYFNDVQNYIKTKTDINIEDFIRYLKTDNIQALINKSFLDGLTVKELGDKLLKMYDTSIEDLSKVDDTLNGERVLNTMENISNDKYYLKKDYKYYFHCDDTIDDTLFKHMGIYLLPIIREKDILTFKNIKEAKEYLKEAGYTWSKKYSLEKVENIQNEEFKLLNYKEFKKTF